MSTVKANNLMNVDGGIPTVKSQQLIPTAWVNFNGTSTVAIRASENVSSITDNGTGNYSANFATNMANINYSAVGINSGANGAAEHSTGIVGSLLVGSVRMKAFKAGVGETDAITFCIVVLGGQS